MKLLVLAEVRANWLMDNLFAPYQLSRVCISIFPKKEHLNNV